MTERRKDDERAWMRPQLTIRLTAARRKQLARLAELEGLEGSPGAVIDRAIELALTLPCEGDEERLGAIEARVEAAERSRADDAADARAALTQVAHELARLRALIAALGDEA